MQFGATSRDYATTLIQSFEGCRLDVYPDVGNLATVGWGCRTDLPIGTTITQDQADELFAQSLERTAQGVERGVTVPLSPQQGAALICFAYNIGVGAFDNSTLLKLLNNGSYSVVPAQLMRWNKVQGEPVAGLTRRRQAEIDLWNTDD